MSSPASADIDNSDPFADAMRSIGVDEFGPHAKFVTYGQEACFWLPTSEHSAFIDFFVCLFPRRKDRCCLRRNLFLDFMAKEAMTSRLERAGCSKHAISCFFVSRAWMYYYLHTCRI
jgi:hypothetical protein